MWFHDLRKTALTALAALPVAPRMAALNALDGEARLRVTLLMDCLWSNKAVRCRHLFWTVMAFILDSVGGRHRCDMRAPVPLVS